MIFPFLMLVVRLIVVSFPMKHYKINAILLRIGVPLIWVYPIFFTFFLIPAVGVCRQLSSPYPLGSVHIYYANPLFGLRNSYFYLYNTIVWLFLSIIANVGLFLKIAKARSQLISFQKGSISYKAELSISITTIVMILFYVINGGFVLIYILYYGTDSYFSFLLIVKPFATDMQTCVVPWIFYLTHPVFKRVAVSDMGVSSTTFSRQMNHS
ncbi:hypothetical protein CAEBREN_13434 [Caenorhabditis brenneri]|uniref:Serpentine receptor class gamma n=1 Tax=Caenorhabditis brenneri TaxID=135651 RepID=G0PC73_CAEBE|nr:hypothetical protein CAEBREN_13434 [Caenorhabditis brenneri]